MKTKFILIFTILFFLGCKTQKLSFKDDVIELADVEKHYLLSDQNSAKYYLIKLIRKLQTEKYLVKCQ